MCGAHGGTLGGMAGSTTGHRLTHRTPGTRPPLGSLSRNSTARRGSDRDVSLLQNKVCFLSLSGESTSPRPKVFSRLFDFKKREEEQRTAS